LNCIVQKYFQVAIIFTGSPNLTVSDKCGPGFYECPASKVCQPTAWKCDGVVDCEGYDENDCPATPTPVIGMYRA